MTELVLASGSPRRRELLSSLGLNFSIRTSDVDETPIPGESPAAMAQRLAQLKAQAVADILSKSGRRALVIGADTVVGKDAVIYGKPDDSADAARMLLELRGSWHQVHSAVCGVDSGSGRQQCLLNTTKVEMREYTEGEIADYVESGDPLDKAGAYAIQHPEFTPVRRIDGCITAVMGLSLIDLCTLLAEFGIRPECAIMELCEAQADFACCQRASQQLGSR